MGSGSASPARARAMFAGETRGPSPVSALRTRKSWDAEISDTARSERRVIVSGGTWHVSCDSGGDRKAFRKKTLSHANTTCDGCVHPSPGHASSFVRADHLVSTDRRFIGF